ncbi:cation diffusion facilitator family transporter [Rhodanobacter denitrificans]|uniref:Cation diffusion facilitator family transporter n=1 Tax=Rhodanobacter denitrificans TaxID=666685 RepID=M4NLB3_9GAMM|nr:cation diffusion facilitator family transporter [Rhodanobacter denitrificans]AGG88511.1 cation diffusion facilitator family transporter [Rhodanobacter denitrificans]UJJ58821.1 cation diffusion facilitator family transporter [Rhodanobacter denitrificans]UJM87646.1 cation diffusion facilitator family transporter [Rhodanobacter denitrificans]
MNTAHADRHAHAHDGDHGYAHDPTAASGSRGRKLLLAFGLTAAMMAVEVAGGAWSGSLALLADAGHMVVDALALLLAIVGARVAIRPADARRSYGYGRMEVLAGFVNALGQFVLVGWIVYEAGVRLLHPGEILSGIMLVVAIAGLLVNALVLRTLHGHAHDDVNLAGASLHVLGDLLGSLAAVLAALAIRWFGWLWADPVLSLLISLLILGSAWRLLRVSAHILLEGVPDGMDSALVEASLRTADPGIRDIHHLHVWQLASGSRMATVHAELAECADGAQALQAIKRMLLERFGIQHVTVQIDPGSCLDASEDCAGHGHR